MPAGQQRQSRALPHIWRRTIPSKIWPANSANFELETGQQLPTSQVLNLGTVNQRNMPSNSLSRDGLSLFLTLGAGSHPPQGGPQEGFLSANIYQWDALNNNNLLTLPTRHANTMILRGERTSVPRTADVMHPVRSLSQVYRQACLVHPELERLAISYARRFNGMFPLETSHRSNTARNADKDEYEMIKNRDNTSHFKFASVKGTSRCMDKLEVAYAGDCSLLLDVSRQTITFSTVDDLVDCLEALCMDQSIDIVR